MGVGGGGHAPSSSPMGSSLQVQHSSINLMQPRCPAPRQALPPPLPPRALPCPAPPLRCGSGCGSGGHGRAAGGDGPGAQGAGAGAEGAGLWAGLWEGGGAMRSGRALEAGLSGRGRGCGQSAGRGRGFVGRRAWRQRGRLGVGCELVVSPCNGMQMALRSPGCRRGSRYGCPHAPPGCHCRAGQGHPL